MHAVLSFESTFFFVNTEMDFLPNLLSVVFGKGSLHAKIPRFHYVQNTEKCLTVGINGLLFNTYPYFYISRKMMFWHSLSNGQNEAISK